MMGGRDTIALTIIPAAITFEHVVKSFSIKGELTPTLNGISGSVPKGNIVSLIGPSGSGKSTLLALCNLLLTADSGDVLIEGKNVLEWNITELRRNVGLVFQSPTMFPGTVLHNLSLAQTLQGTTLENPESYLTKVGLPTNLLHRDASDLSGGQKQRVALARVLATKPSILLLDEITSALDPSAARDVEEWVLQIHKDNQTTILWVTHNLEQAERVSQWTWFMVGGQLIEATETKQFFSTPQTKEGELFLSGQ
ncbi:MAG: phosphate ABC transporter ATP-binding protein [Acidibacillus sp.]|nr:phosphate ABC transporter ATP-binding protein [Acidibacillus sp.]